MRPGTNQGDLNWLLDDLTNRVPGVRQTIVLSADGLLMASSRAFGRDDAEHLSAVAASVQSLARGVGRRFKGGPTRQTIIEMESAYLLVTAAGRGACLAVLAEGDADIGVIAYEAAMLVGRLGTHLSTTERSATTHPGNR